MSDFHFVSHHLFLFQANFNFSKFIATLSFQELKSDCSAIWQSSYLKMQFAFPIQFIISFFILFIFFFAERTLKRFAPWISRFELDDLIRRTITVHSANVYSTIKKKCQLWVFSVILEYVECDEFATSSSSFNQNWPESAAVFARYHSTKTTLSFSFHSLSFRFEMTSLLVTAREFICQKIR